MVVYERRPISLRHRARPSSIDPASATPRSNCLALLPCREDYPVLRLMGFSSQSSCLSLRYLSPMVVYTKRFHCPCCRAAYPSLRSPTTSLGCYTPSARLTGLLAYCHCLGCITASSRPPLCAMVSSMSPRAGCRVSLARPAALPTMAPSVDLCHLGPCVPPINGHYFDEQIPLPPSVIHCSCSGKMVFLLILPHPDWCVHSRVDSAP
jgi:hypothetical protein